MNSDNVNCLNPWDIQSIRLYDTKGSYHSLFASSEKSDPMRYGVVYAIDQQGGKGSANYSKDIMPSILSDSHGTPHAVCYRKSTKPGNGSAETWVQDDITNTLNGHEFHSQVRTPEVIVGRDLYNGELTGDKAVITISCKQQSLVTTDNLANTLGANDYKEPQSVVYDI